MPIPCRTPHVGADADDEEDLRPGDLADRPLLHVGPDEREDEADRQGGEPDVGVEHEGQDGERGESDQGEDLVRPRVLHVDGLGLRLVREQVVGVVVGFVTPLGHRLTLGIAVRSRAALRGGHRDMRRRDRCLGLPPPSAVGHLRVPPSTADVSPSVATAGHVARAGVAAASAEDDEQPDGHDEVHDEAGGERDHLVERETRRFHDTVGDSRRC